VSKDYESLTNNGQSPLKIGGHGLIGLQNLGQLKYSDKFPNKETITTNS
jgi:hypothetical protein